MLGPVLRLLAWLDSDPYAVERSLSALAEALMPSYPREAEKARAAGDEDLAQLLLLPGDYSEKVIADIHDIIKTQLTPEARDEALLCALYLLQIDYLCLQGCFCVSA